MLRKPFLRVILSLLTLVTLSLTTAAQQLDYLKPENFVRRRYHASAKVGNYVYIDGGEWSYREANGNIKMEPMQKTFSLDLSKSWTNKSVILKEIDRGGAPLFNLRSFWVDESTSTIHTFGGENSWITGDVPSRPQPWYFRADGEGGGLWGEDRVDTYSVFNSLVQPAAGLHTFGDGTGFYFGGHLVEKTWPSRSWYPVTGLITYNFSSNEWSNRSSTGYGNLVPSHGIAEFIPSLGPTGLLVMFGGRDSTDEAITGNDRSRSFDNITLYDPRSGNWFWQTATGNVPKWRDRACSVAVEGSDETYEIFIYAGTNLGVYGGEYPTPDESRGTIALDEIFVLSLPGFVWFKANYTSTHTRQGHTCVAVGRQLLTIGGMDPAEQEYNALAAANATDTFSQGLGIFDLTDMLWSDHYNATAVSYESPQIIEEYYRTNARYPSHWDSGQLQSLILNGTLSGEPSPTTTASSVPSHTSHSENSPMSTMKAEDIMRENGGIIAGAATGSFAALVAIGMLTYVFVRRRRKRVTKKREIRMIELDSRRFEELPDQPRIELPEHQYWELHTDPIIPPKVRLSAMASTR